MTANTFIAFAGHLVLSLKAILLWNCGQLFTYVTRFEKILFVFHLLIDVLIVGGSLLFRAIGVVLHGWLWLELLEYLGFLECLWVKNILNREDEIFFVGYSKLPFTISRLRSYQDTRMGYIDVSQKISQY